MAILYYGPDNAINRSITSFLGEVGTAKIVWVCNQPKSQEETLSNGVEVIFNDANLSLEKLIEASFSKGKVFKQIVFADSTGGVRPLKLNKEAFVEEMFQKNVFSFFEFIRVLLKRRHLETGASIVALSSVSSIKGLKSKSVYSSSKAALDAAVKGMAAELAPKKIRVNSIQKGWVDVDMELDFIKDNMSLSNGSDFELQPLGAIPVEELARLVRFLLSDELTTMTGTNLVLDGGYTL